MLFLLASLFTAKIDLQTSDKYANGLSFLHSYYRKVNKSSFSTLLSCYCRCFVCCVDRCVFFPLAWLVTAKFVSRISDFLFLFANIYPPFTRKQIVLLSFGRDIRTRLGVAIFELSWKPFFHIKMGASRAQLVNLPAFSTTSLKCRAPSREAVACLYHF